MMTISFDQSDVPLVRSSDMTIALRAVVEAGRARVFFEGADASDRGLIEGAFWKSYQGEAAQGGITLLRLWCLIDALQTRRLKARLFDSGFSFLDAAVIAAANLRLNLEWGFAPQRLIWAVVRAEAQRVSHSQQRYELDRSQPLHAEIAA
jgi:hypothetical protein